MNNDYYNCGYYANQKELTIHRENVFGSKDRNYLNVWNDNLLQAMKDLTPSAFKVYLFLLMNRDGFRLEFSPQFIANSVNVNKDTARTAFKQMEEYGYIKHRDDNKFDFFEAPNLNKEQYPDDFYNFL